MFIFLAGSIHRPTTSLAHRMKVLAISLGVALVAAVVFFGAVGMTVTNQAAARHAQPVGPSPIITPALPPLSAYKASEAQSKAVIAQVTQMGLAAERASRSSGAGHAQQTSALQSWNAFFASHTGVKHQP